MSELSFEDLNNMNLPSIDRVDLLERLRIVRFKGPIDKSTLAELLEIREKIAQTSDLNDVNILFDFAKVTSVDTSTVVQVMTRIMELQQNNKVLGMINVPQELPDLIERIKIETSEPIRFYASEEEAVTGLNH